MIAEGMVKQRFVDKILKKETEIIKKLQLDIVNDWEIVESIQKLNEANRDLKKTNKAIRLEMEKLKAQGKEGSEQFKQLETAYQSNTAAMRENSKQVKELGKLLCQFDVICLNDCSDDGYAYSRLASLVERNLVNHRYLGVTGRMG